MFFCLGDVRQQKNPKRRGKLAAHGFGKLIEIRIWRSSARTLDVDQCEVLTNAVPPEECPL